MTFSVQALASGSSGNSMLVTQRCKDAPRAFLIDAGLGVKSLESYLHSAGLVPSDVGGIVITHEHSDHTRAAYALSRKYGVPLIANTRTLAAIFGSRPETAHRILPTGESWDIGDLTVKTFSVPHDAVDPVGVTVSSRTHQATFLTDLGCVTPELQRQARGADLLVIEMNHCVYRLKAGPYPDLLKRRILSNRGHLSNEDAVRFMVDHVNDKGPCSIWLAHLSKVNNLPKLALNYARATLKVETEYPFAMEVARRDRPSASWAPGRSNLQLSLF